MTCISGPPCTPGKTVASICFANFSSHITMPPRGPRKLLCVVVVTNCACGIGLGCCPPATRPAMWAISIKRSAPTESAIWRIRGRAGGDHGRPHFFSLFLQRVVVDLLGFLRDAVLRHGVKFAGEICGMA